MKKILVLPLIAYFSGAVHADEEKQIVSIEENSADSFTGSYFALGIKGSFLQNKGYADAASVKGNIVKKDINRFAGTTVLGAGKVFDNSIYLGGEVLVDFCKTRKSDLEVHIGGTTTTIGTVKNSGIIPSLALRTGWVNNDCLFFVKLGAALPYTTYDSSTSSNFFKMSKASCRIGLGFEKFLGKKFSGRLEGEYAVGHKKARTLNGINLESKAGIGFNIRALVAYNIKS